MRLGQLSRKLEREIDEVVVFLADQGIELKRHPNVKVDESTEKLLFAHFLPEALDEQKDEIEEQTESKEQLKDTVERETQADTPTVVSVLEEESSKEEEEISTELAEEDSPQTLQEKQIITADLSPAGQDEDVELIKAPKVSLPGLKVVGKIDLPEPKVDKEESATEDENDESQKQAETHKTVVDEKTGVTYVYHNHRNKRKRLSPEEKEAQRLRNKKAKEKRLKLQAEKRKEREANAIKRKKEQHYKKKIATKAISKAPTSKANKKSGTAKADRPQQRKAPKSLLGKFWRWLNT